MSDDSSANPTEVAVPKSPARLTNRPQVQGHRVPAGYMSVPTPVITPSGDKRYEQRQPTPLPVVLPPINAHRCAKCQEIDEPPRVTTPEPVKRPQDVKMTAVLSAVNDLVHLLGSKNSLAGPNVKFVKAGTYKDDASEYFHSFILLARSDWFRRSWRALQSNVEDSEYNFRKSLDSGINKYDIGIDFDDQNGLPREIDHEFQFSLVLPDANECPQFDYKEFRKAFKQFKKYLYTGDCEISERIAGYLASLAHAFRVESLKEFLSDYYKTKFQTSEPSPNNCDAILEQLEIAHNYKMTSLRDECIRLVNANALAIINSARWQEISDKYPELVLITFNKNA